MIITTVCSPTIWPNIEYIIKNNVVYGFTMIVFFSQRAKTIINYLEQVEFGVVNKYCEIRADIYFYARSYNSLKQ